MRSETAELLALAVPSAPLVVPSALAVPATALVVALNVLHVAPRAGFGESAPTPSPLPLAVLPQAVLPLPVLPQ